MKAIQTFKKRWELLTKQEKYTVYSVLGGGVLAVGIIGVVIASQRSPQTKEPSQVEMLPVSEEQDQMDEAPLLVSPLSGQECDRYNGRPFGVMVASDTTARPLSGINQAEIVVEMPVITSSVTRLMAVFVCNLPEEVGSVRSARHDFISLMRGWDGILVHWGGSSFALDELSNGIRYTGENLGKLDNVNALNAGGVFFRKDTVPAPHNGFASLQSALTYSQDRGYRLEEPEVEPYLFLNESEIEEAKAEGEEGTVYVGFAGIYGSRWEYTKDNNRYARFWANQRDTDSLDGEGVNASNVVVMKAASQQIQDQYNTVDIYGEGDVRVYQNGQEIVGKWKKDGFKGTLKFFDGDDKEIALVPGLTYIQIIEPQQNVSWELNSTEE